MIKIKPNFYVVKLKKNLLPAIFLLFTCGLIVFSNSNLPAVKSGLKLWATSVVPSLFPFFVATELLMHTRLVSQIGNVLNSYMKPIFNVRGEGAFAFIMGIISGYPMGAKLATNFRKNNICSKEECERLLSFTNNSGPLFIIGTVGILMYGNTTIGILLFITHILACITVGFIFRFWKRGNNSCEYSTKKSSGILHILSDCFAPILQAFNIDTSFASPLISGFLEITNGINSIANISNKKISINLIFTAFLLGFGGISVLLQVLSITSKSNLSIKPYIYGKLLHGILASFYTYIFINIIPFFNFDI